MALGKTQRDALRVEVPEGLRASVAIQFSQQVERPLAPLITFVLLVKLFRTDDVDLGVVAVPRNG